MKIETFKIDFLKTTVHVVIDNNWQKWLKKELTHPVTKECFFKEEEGMAAGSTYIDRKDLTIDGYICCDVDVDRNVFLHEITHLFFMLVNRFDIKVNDGESTALLAAYIYDEALKASEKLNKRSKKCYALPQPC